MAARDHGRGSGQDPRSNAKILAETERDARRRQRRSRPFKLSADKRNQAVQAFWAMHVETLSWDVDVILHPRNFVATMEFAKLEAEVGRVFSTVQSALDRQGDKR